MCRLAPWQERHIILSLAGQLSAPCTGRDNKVGKEEHVGMLAAVETWVKRNHAEEETLETINQGLY